MKVKELIQKLLTVDPDLVVLTNGYEGGYREVVFSDYVREFNRDVYTDWYYGPHEEVSYDYDALGTGDFKGILL
jgi:hypothetical protein